MTRITFEDNFFYLQAESDIGPSLALPSISEDDENLAEENVNITMSPLLSNITRSPLHSSPRHSKFINR